MRASASFGCRCLGARGRLRRSIAGRRRRRGWSPRSTSSSLDPPPTGLGSPTAPVQRPAGDLQRRRARRAGQRRAQRRRRRRVHLVRRRQDRRQLGLRRRRQRQRMPIETRDAQGRHADEPHGARCRWPSARRRSGSTSRSSHATGASPTIYFRNAFIAEVQTPPDLTAANATFCSPFNGKFLIFDHATGTGQLVVTSVFGNAFAVTDTGVPPGAVQQHLPVRVRQAAAATSSRGACITSFSGNYSKFVGFTELNFPLFDAADRRVPLAPVPPPVPLRLRRHRQPAQDARLRRRQRGAATRARSATRSRPTRPTTPTSSAPSTAGTSTTSSSSTTTAPATSFTNIAVELPAKVLGTLRSAAERRQDRHHHRHAAQQLGPERVPRRQRQRRSPARRRRRAPRAAASTGTCYKNAFNFWTHRAAHARTTSSSALN